MTTDTEALARRTHHMAEGDVLDDQGFIDPFAEDGVFNGAASGSATYATAKSRSSTAISA